jgi:hypothetical protein
MTTIDGASLLPYRIISNAGICFFSMMLLALLCYLELEAVVFYICSIVPSWIQFIFLCFLCYILYNILTFCFSELNAVTLEKMHEDAASQSYANAGSIFVFGEELGHFFVLAGKQGVNATRYEVLSAKGGGKWNRVTCTSAREGINRSISSIHVIISGYQQCKQPVNGLCNDNEDGFYNRFEFMCPSDATVTCSKYIPNLFQQQFDQNIELFIMHNHQFTEIVNLSTTYLL